MKTTPNIIAGISLVLLIGVFTHGYSQEVIDSLVGHPINFAKNITHEIISEPLNYNVNTSYKEFKPLVSSNGKELYFSRQSYPENVGGIEDREDIWYCRFNDETQEWEKAVNIGPPLNTEGPNFVSGIGKSGDTLLLGNVYTKRGKLMAGVSVSVRVNDTWSQPQRIYLENDYNYAPRSSYDVSSDRKAILIAEHKDDSEGGMDLYVAFDDPDGKHTYSGTEGINLGPVINTFEDETSPYLTDDNKTLYFSSKGHNGYGGMDIFVSKRLDDTWQNWSEPENLGPAVNTEFDDLFFNFSPYSKYAYYSRGITESNVDIYRVDLTQLFKEVEMKTLKKGKLKIPVEIGQTVRIKDAFNLESDLINLKAKEDLNNLTEFLKEHPSVEILIITHSSKHVIRQESQELSEKRALAVKNYLELKGIDEHRLHSDPKGHDIVVNSKDSFERQYLHNMIGIKFIKM